MKPTRFLFFDWHAIDLVCVLIVIILAYFASFPGGFLSFGVPSPPGGPPSPPTPTPLPTVLLSLSPETGEVAEDDSLSLDILLDATQQPVESIDVVLTFDPDYFKLSDLMEGTIPNLEYSVIPQGEGKAKLVGFPTDPDAPPFSDSGTFGTVVLKALKVTSQTQVEFNPNETVAALGGDQVSVSTRKGIYGITSS